mmetsp:Transcript_178/g.282  ORF Transcript_178/g.282 Transcript_178/m.282 type:complete len:263 (+) Transcript_178:910-1698(+)
MGHPSARGDGEARRPLPLQRPGQPVHPLHVHQAHLRGLRRDGERRDAGEARLRHLPGQPADWPLGGRQGVQAALRQPRAEPARHQRAQQKVRHHPPKPRLRHRHRDASRRVEAALHQPQRRLERGHHARVDALVLGPVPPRGQVGPVGHVLPLRPLHQLDGGPEGADHHGARGGQVRPAARAAPDEGAPPRVGRPLDRTGGRVRLLGRAGDQGAQGGGRAGGAHQPEHRLRADEHRRAGHDGRRPSLPPPRHARVRRDDPRA